MNELSAVSESRLKFTKTEVLLICCIAIQLIIALLPFNYGSGYFRDELYQIALSHHLAFGYVDVPPLCPFMLAVVRNIFGMSLFSLHLLPAIAGAIVIFLTYRMVKIFEGDFFAMAFALLPVTFMSAFVGSLFVYDTFDFLFWNIIIYCLVKLFQAENRNYWIYFGIAAGFALLTKITIVFLGAGVVTALLLTKERKYFACFKFWFAGLIALLIFSPYVIWNIYHGFPTVEFFCHYASGKLINMTPFFYIKAQVFSIYMPALLVWILGLYYFLFYGGGKKYRVVGIAYIVILVLCVSRNTRPNLIWAYYPVLLAGGGAFLGLLLKNRKFIWFKWLYILFIIGACFYNLPNYRPILPLNVYMKYYGNKGENTLQVEKFKAAVLPQILADRFGWKEMAEEVAEVYNSLPPEKKSQTAIYAANYGEAGAISFFGRQYGLPEAISGHNQYYLWGPGNYTGQSVIMVLPDVNMFKNPAIRKLLYKYKKLFKFIILKKKMNNKYCLPDEDGTIWLCESYKPLKKIWPLLKHYN